MSEGGSLNLNAPYVLKQLPPGEMPPPFDPNVASSPASQINIAPNEYAPATNQDPNQPAMTIEEAK
jgi:hypothetical protein